MDIIVALQDHPWLFYTWIILLGLCIGSFLNVVIHRLPIMLEIEWRAECESFLSEGTIPQQNDLNLLKPSSHCPSCKHKIKWHHNIPLLGYLILHGRCNICNAPISCRYFFVELLTALLSLCIAYELGVSWECFAALIFTWVLIAMTFIDIDKQILPDNLTLGLLWLGLFTALFDLFTPIEDAVVGAISGYLFFWIIGQFYKLFTDRIGLGQGDYKLLAAIGAWLGWQYLPFVVLTASTAGALSGIAYILVTKANKQTPIPFGPFLALAAFVALVFGDFNLTQILLPGQEMSSL